MELESIKLSGFKSFADSTVLPLKSKLVAIVGPNGCGKSNIVDAVRCVLSGAARQLRGDTLPDVIFNGSKQRKPVGQASVELIFDNSGGGFGGEYAQFSQVSVRREINRDGTSDYFLNGGRCRRRDIVDLFLGTGLRYAIIEQGMISRLIEAKPEELRMHLEDAAGTSIYKERRRETENRLQHTKENIERLNDHRAELEKQLKHLQRQASAAEKYKEYKQEERILKAELQVIYYQQLDHEILQQDHTIKAEENQYEVWVTDLREINLAIEKLRVEQNENQDAYNSIHERYYMLGSDIARYEQTIRNFQERSQQLTEDLLQLEKSHQEINSNYTEDKSQIASLNNDIASLQPQIFKAHSEVESAQNHLQNAEKNMHTWQQNWDEFSKKAAALMQMMGVEETNIQHLENTLMNYSQRIHRLKEEQTQMDFQSFEIDIKNLSEELENNVSEQNKLQQRLDDLTSQWQSQRELENQTTNELAEIRNQLQTLIGRFSSLQALQQEALGKNDQIVSQWLQQNQLQQNQRLAETLEVEPGWEMAVETVLGSYLEAVCVDNFTTYINAAADLKKGSVSLFNQASNPIPTATHHFLPELKTKIKSSTPVMDLLNSIYVVEDLTQALDYCENLNANESIITKQGIWIGRNWLRVINTIDAKAGILQREKEIHELNDKIKDYEQQKVTTENTLSAIKNLLSQIEIDRKITQDKLLDCSALINSLQTKLSQANSRIEQMQLRDQNILQELDENNTCLQEITKQLSISKDKLQEAQNQLQQSELEKETYLKQKEQLQNFLYIGREQAIKSQNNLEELKRRNLSSADRLQFLNNSIIRAEKQLDDIKQRCADLQKMCTELTAPLEEAKNILSSNLENRLLVEQELEAAKLKLNHIEHELREKDKLTQDLQKKIEVTRTQLENQRMKLQSLKLKQENHYEKLRELNFEKDTVLQNLSSEANAAAWEEKIQSIENKIQRLGAINLAAIEEHQVLSERKVYLDKQYSDLTEAIETLETAIKKIDRETRSKLQETFEKVNNEFNSLFQRIFGGGNAQLELLGEDVLSTGVIVKAQPPGKKNTTIHLLSGGEKALTATALVFAMFQLNPAPFCILDEVDAPLDDINVGRFGALVKEMSKKVQFIFISHNKLTIEIADQLVGVTMLEPGVSRLVSVDVKQAIEMATAE